MDFDFLLHFLGTLLGYLLLAVAHGLALLVLTARLLWGFPLGIPLPAGGFPAGRGARLSCDGPPPRPLAASPRAGGGGPC